MKDFLNSLDHETKVNMTKLGTGGGLATASFVTMSDIIGLLTIIYFVMQIWIIWPKFWPIFKATIVKIFKRG